MGERIFVQMIFGKDNKKEEYVSSTRFDYENPEICRGVMELKGKIIVSSKIIQNIIPATISGIEKIIGKEIFFNHLRIECNSLHDCDEIDIVNQGLEKLYNSGKIKSYNFVGRCKG